ncbi:MAG TPA: recombinase family protein [Pirellulales bacterium]|jgi:DNA invertase Pin-like site-specific DNA recombinase
MTPAVGYLRRSTEKQEGSLADQRREIERYAESNGYRIVRWYEDDGISGDATEKRTGFLAMHRAACNGPDFEAILVWDQDRFGRFDSIEAGHWIHPLRNAGVRLVTVAEGPVNWNDFTGRMMYSMKQEGKHQFLRDLSRNTARGQITNAKRGFLCGQAASYGYDRMLVDESGAPLQRVKNGESVAKPRSWHVTLVPTDEPERLDTARWLFDTYANEVIGMRRMAETLNQRGVPGPTGGRWFMGTIREMLRNEAYVGRFVWAKRRMGNYHRVDADEIKARTDGHAMRYNAPESRIVKENAHPAIIDGKIFRAVQEKLDGKKAQRRGKKASPDAYLLSGLLYCGHCGRKMYGSLKSRRKASRTYYYPKYICSTYCSAGRTTGCGYHSVDQGLILDFLVDKLRTEILAGGHREALRQEVLSILRESADSGPGRVEDLRDSLAKIERELEVAKRRFLKAPDDVADMLADELSKMRKSRDLAAVELTKAESTCSTDSIEETADAYVDRLWNLAQEIEKASPSRLRQILSELVDRIDLYFDHVPRGKRIECPISKGISGLREIRPISFRDNRGDCPSFEPFIAACVDAAFSPSSDILVAARILKYSA